MTDLHVDVETRSAVDLRAANVYVYAEHPSTDVWCMAYAFGDGPITLWVPGDPCPAAIRDHIEAGGRLYAHNAQFERIIWRDILSKRHGWPDVPLDQWRCTMAMALAMNLPASLDNASRAVGITAEKDMAGNRLMLQMAAPRREDPLVGYVWWDDEGRRQRLYEYCRQDVEVERQLHQRIAPLSPEELATWQLDQEINDRGVYVDQNVCRAAKQIVQDATAEANRKMRELTGGEVGACSNVAELRAWLENNGLSLLSLRADIVEEALKQVSEGAPAHQALTLRQAAAKTSTAKINAMLNRRSDDGRLRGHLQYHGAGQTGRWAGRGFQPQNLPRPAIITPDNSELAVRYPQALSEEDLSGRMVADALSMIAKGDADLLEQLYGAPLAVVSDCIRGLIQAAPGNTFYCADFSNIEGRVLAWLAGEPGKLRAFSSYDEGSGADVYKVTASEIFGVPVEQIGKGTERQIGKVAELALGYQGGVGAFLTMARTYRLKIGDHFDTICLAMSADVLDKTDKAWEQRGKGSGVDVETWKAAEAVKIAWRMKHPRVVQFWYDLEDAAVSAVCQPGEVFSAGPVRFRKKGSFLLCQLPSRRVIYYPYAKLEDKPTPWGDTRIGLAYKSVDSFTKRFDWQDFYGGKAAENVTQAVARDVMRDAMHRLKAAGYPCVMTVHDEELAETEEGFGDLDEFLALMARVPEWADGLPVAVAGWTGRTYRK